MRVFGIVALGAAFVLSLTVAARADCDDAVRSYNSAISDIESYLRRYTNCLSSTAPMIAHLSSGGSDLPKAITSPPSLATSCIVADESTGASGSHPPAGRARAQGEEMRKPIL
jgi:hypothetical protein